MTKVWLTLHNDDTKELLINVANVESIAELREPTGTYHGSECIITMVSGQKWKIRDYDVDELANIFDEQVTT